MQDPIDHWPILPDERGLETDEVHVWRVTLDRPEADARRCFDLLSTDELLRAERLYSEQDRFRFAAGRSALRSILGRLLDEDPRRLVFEYAENGKPGLANREVKDKLQFNVSHSHGLALIAAAWSRPVGVDVEQVREMADFGEIVERFFSRHERAAFAEIAPDLKADAFFRGWVRKEAVLKVIGAGMSLPLDSFDVEMTPGQPARLLRIEGPPDEARRWSLADLNPAPGFVASLAVEGAGWRLVGRDFGGGGAVEKYE
ncbi:MAG TPA: 4'-phosphopantetheinyl transferase superfamily protein [Pirellulales bacterium]|nr:4'-phosphopantetheinyl transferase superfamily protein [Pirellulales bacterium]